MAEETYIYVLPQQEGPDLLADSVMTCFDWDERKGDFGRVEHREMTDAERAEWVAKRDAEGQPDGVFMSGKPYRP